MTSEPLNFDRVAGEYDATRFMPAASAHAAAERLLAAADLRPGETLVDAGVGTGRFAIPIACAGSHVVGLDVSTQMMEALRSKLAALSPGRPSLRLARADLRQLPMRSNSVGAVFGAHILHLIPEWKTVIGEIRRILKPGKPLLLGWEDGARSYPTRRYYFSRARELGIVSEHPGARVEGFMREFEAQGAAIDSLETSDIHWSHRVSVRDALEAVRRRTWSSLWSAPEAQHQKLIEETTEWALSTYGSLEAEEDSEAAFKAISIRWPV